MQQNDDLKPLLICRKSITRNYVSTDNHLQTLNPFLEGWYEENALG
jgi:hypothetical protein